MQEIWKDIPGYEGYYQVSDFGRVKSLARVISHSHYFRKIKERILKLASNGDGYNKVMLCRDGNHKSMKTYKLVAIAFLGYRPGEDGLVVDHINNIKADDRLSNLQLITQRENTSKDRWRKNHSSKYTGVCWDKTKKKWKARIQINKKNKHLGCFKSEIEASEYYQQALKNFNEGIEIKIKKVIFSSKYTGVSWSKKRKKWTAQITINYKQIFLGYFKTELEAHEAYQYYKKHGRRIEAPVQDY